jgi:hypothetical protein
MYEENHALVPSHIPVYIIFDVKKRQINRNSRSYCQLEKQKLESSHLFYNRIKKTAPQSAGLRLFDKFVLTVFVEKHLCPLPINPVGRPSMVTFQHVY